MSIKVKFLEWSSYHHALIDAKTMPIEVEWLEVRNDSISTTIVFKRY